MVNKIKNFMKKKPYIYDFFRNIFFIFDTIKRKTIKILSIPFLIFPVKKNKIVVCNYFGKGYGDSGKYIIKEIIEQDLDYDIVWLLKKELMKESKFPNKVRAVKYGSLMALFELSTAKIWLDNSRKIFYPVKRKEQFYIQLWHSPLGLKTIEKDAEKYLSNYYINGAIYDSKISDLMISGSNFSYERIKRAFWYDGEIAEIGTPRCDIFFKEENIKSKVRKHFEVEEDIKLILYAPTFRRHNDVSIYTLDFNRIISKLNKYYNEKFKFLVRLHPNISEKTNIIQYNKNVLNATKYDDIQELLYSCDFLITDYSSSMFDMLIAKKNCLLHVPDIENYIVNERPLYFNIYDLPFPVSRDTDELINNLTKFNKTQYHKKIESFSNSIGIYENGEASERIIGIMNKHSGL